MFATHKHQTGFSLIELSIVLVIVGLLVGSFIGGFSTYNRNRLIQHAETDLKNIREALIGYALQNQRLPCPDVDGPGAAGFGIEDPEGGPVPGGDCAAQASPAPVAIGFLPFVDLGLRGMTTDPWGYPYAYAVDRDFADAVASACPNTNAPNSFGLCNIEVGRIEIKNMGDQGTGSCAAPCSEIANNVVAVFYSFGEARFNEPSIHEQDNIATPFGSGLASDPNDVVYVRRTYNRDGADQFDDQIMWLPSTILKLKMLEAGHLP